MLVGEEEEEQMIFGDKDSMQAGSVGEYLLFDGESSEDFLLLIFFTGEEIQCRSGEVFLCACRQ